MQLTPVNQPPPNDRFEDSIEDFQLGNGTLGSGRTLILQAQLAQIDTDFGALRVTSTVFESLRAFVRHSPIELERQEADLERQRPEVRVRYNQFPADGELPSVQTLLFEVNFKHFQENQDTASVPFAA